MPNESSKRTPKWARWVPLVQTSPSGKVLFVCLVCGAVSTAPDKRCVQPHPETRTRRGLDPRILKAFPGAETCDDIERHINEEIVKNIEDKRVLDWAEDQLQSFMDRQCPWCWGYGCHVCVGRGKRW